MKTPSDLSALSIARTANTRRHAGPHGVRPSILIAASLVGIGISIWTWQQFTPLTVETVVVSNVYPSQLLTVLNATGYVVAQRKASVASKATGRLEWLGVLEGSDVHIGDVIARLENGDTQALRDQAAANVLLAKANVGQGQAELSEAELAFNRSEALIEKKLVSESAHDSAVGRLGKARAAVAGLEAAVAVAQANLRVAEVALDQTIIRAPFDGVVITRNANVGDTITPFSQAVDTKGAVVTIADMDTLEVEASVTESSFMDIQVGQPVEIQLDAMPGLRFDGQVSLMVPTVDRAKASVLVKVRFMQRDPKMLPDMSAKVAFLKRPVEGDEHKPILVVPASAIVEAGDGKSVWMIDEGKARLRRVEVGAKVGEQVVVHGLEVGTRVVIRASDTLVDGRAVTKDAK